MNIRFIFKLSKSILALLLLFSFIKPVVINAEDRLKVGILQYVEHEALDAARQGFEDRLNESSLADQIEIDVQNANGDQSNLQSISEKLVRDNDILFAIATPAAQALAIAEQTKPIFFAAVTDPVEAGLVDSNEKPGRNLSGTSDQAPIEDQVALLRAGFPEIKTVGMIYNASEVNSQIQAERAQELLGAEGIQVEVETVVSTNDIAQALNSLLNKVDAMFMVTDNTIDSAISLVGDMAKEKNIPTIGSSSSVVEANGLATVSNSYYDYGVQTADMLIRMLEENLSISEIPVEFGKDYKVIINDEFAEAIGVDGQALRESYEALDKE